MSASVASLRGAAASVSARARRALAVVAGTVVLAVLLAYGLVPFARRWRARETAIAARTTELARVRGLVVAEPTLGAAVRTRERRAGGPSRVIAARTPTMAVATLQTALQGAALASGVQLQLITVSEPEGIDAVGAPDDAPPTVSASLAALGDVHGVTALLAALRDGPTLVEVTALAVQATHGPRGEPLLQLTLGVRAPWSAP